MSSSHEHQRLDLTNQTNVFNEKMFFVKLIIHSACILIAAAISTEHIAKLQNGDSSKHSTSNLTDDKKHDNNNKSNMQNRDALSSVNIIQILERYIPEKDVGHYYNVTDKKPGSLSDTFNAADKPLETDHDEVSVCVNNTGRLIVGLLNGDDWAIQFLDATGKPGPSVTKGWLNFVGNYDQCKSASAPPIDEGSEVFYGGYFQITLKSPSIPVLIKIGACLPDTCSENEIESLATQLIHTGNVSMSVKSVHHLNNDTEVTSATVVAIVVSCIIGILVIFGTGYDIAFVQFPLWYEERSTDKDASLLWSHENGNNNKNGDIVVSNGNRSDNLETAPLLKSMKIKSSGTKRSNVLSKVLLAFSVYSNAKKILSVSKTQGSLDSIHGIRFFSMCWVLLGHIYLFSMPYAMNASTALPTFLRRWTFDAVSNAYFSVDTFFTLSGLLVSYLTIGQFMKNGLKFNWSMFYFHRFWRLTPPYMLVILLYLGFQQYFIRGSMRSFEQPTDKSACENHWWTNLLYINNLVHTGTDGCFGHSWYMANDMQFFILSPLMMVPFYFHRVAGLCSCLVFLLASWITTGVSSTLENWAPLPMTAGIGTDDYFRHYYITPWCRIGPFIVGIATGYVLALYKGRRVTVNKWIVVLGWFTATASALALLYGIHGDIEGTDTSSKTASALYNTVSRSVWGACIGWMIIACTTGYGGPVNTLLSWSPFVVLGRMSYMVYLLHPPIINVFLQNLDAPFYMNHTTMVVIYLGVLVATHLIAFVFMLYLESPMIGLEKAFLNRGKK